MTHVDIKIAEPVDQALMLLSSDSQEIGRLDIRDDVIVFTGNADKAAQVFFQHVKWYVDQYIESSNRQAQKRSRSP